MSFLTAQVETPGGRGCGYRGEGVELMGKPWSPMPQLQPLTLPFDGGALPITPDQWMQYIAPTLEDQRGDLETVGPWQLPVRYTAPAVSLTWVSGFIQSVTLYGPRTMSRPRQASYHLEGQVSVGGRKLNAYTSSVICRLPDGKLLEAAVIQVRPTSDIPSEGD